MLHLFKFTVLYTLLKLFANDSVKILQHNAADSKSCKQFLSLGRLLLFHSVLIYPESACYKHYSRNEADTLLYENQCYLYNSLVKKTLSNYFSSLFQNCSDSKSLLRLINKVCHRSSSSSLNPPSTLY